MRSATRAVAEQFLLSRPITLLALGIALAIVDFGALYSAASKEGVLKIDRGVGLLQNYGLLSAILGNCFFLYLARAYYEVVHSIRESKAVTDGGPIESPLRELVSMMRTEHRYRFLIYLLIIVGSLFWLSNVGFHLIGSPEVRWGHKVFDSPDHKLTFCASRAHNLYSWLIVLPILGHTMICTSIQLRRMIQAAAQKHALQYDLLNPDQKGGFLFIEKAHVIFSAVIALLYIQITLHIETFERMHVDHVMAYLVVTLLLLSINRLFLGEIYIVINTLKLEALNRVKEKVYRDDKLSFDILKYCYDHRINEFSLVNFSIKVGAILASGLIKAWPILSKVMKV